MLEILAAAALAAGEAPHQPGTFVCAYLPGAEQVLPEEADPEWPLILMGEIHGTVEMPDMFFDLVCQASKRAPVTVFLEWPVSATPLVEVYFTSNRSEEALRPLLEVLHVGDGPSDGRTSESMMALLNGIGLLRSLGADIKIVCFQPDYAFFRPDGTGAYYELAMAQEWMRGVAENPESIKLGLTGNFHSSQKPLMNLPSGPAASLLRDEDVISLNPGNEGGMAWMMGRDEDGNRQDGPRSLGSGAPTELQLPRGIYLEPHPDGSYDGQYFTGGSLTASQPYRAEE